MKVSDAPLRNAYGIPINSSRNYTTNHPVRIKSGPIIDWKSGPETIWRLLAVYFATTLPELYVTMCSNR